MATKQCKVCKNTLKFGNIYCSKKCYWSISPKFKYPCKNCGKSFWTYPSFQKVNEGFLCSQKCHYLWIKKSYKGKESKKHPELAKKAQTKLNHAIERNGFLRKPCEICGNKKSHGHHEDYSKPLEVRWLCHKHHQLLHFNKLKLTVA